MRLLILGGTAEAARLAHALAGRADIDATLSLAGRTATPAPLPLPTRIGGFGGVDWLVAFLRRERVDAVIDATHPFAARISAHAVAACRTAGVPLAAMSRPAWEPRSGDRWTRVADGDAAVRHLAALPAQAVFLTTGRQGLAVFRAAPQHDYLIRTIDPPAPETLPPHATVLLGRGPFAIEAEIATMRGHGVALLVSKNSGGEASAAKLAAARELGVPVLMVDRPALPDRPLFDAVGPVLVWVEAHRPPR